MKTNIFKLIFLTVLTAATGVINAQNIFPSTGSAGIGTTTPNASSILEVKSTTKGMLTPRMTQAQRNAIASPATGLLIFQTDQTKGFYYYSGTAWTAVNPNNVRGLNNNLFIGTTAGNSNGTGIGNIALGKAALKSNVDAIGNIAIGDSANYACVGANYFDGNIAIGYKTLCKNVSDENLGIGTMALYNNTSGYANSAIGDFTLQKNVSGRYNVAVGFHTMSGNTSGNYNTAVGSDALYNSTGSFNVAVGYNSLYTNDAGIHNTAVGASSLSQNTSGNNNTGCGFGALQNCTIGYENTAVGSGALQIDSSGERNTAIGNGALYNNKNGLFNQAFGWEALWNNTHGNSNVATGGQALFDNTIGIAKTATGTYALQLNQTGNYNTAFGYQSGFTTNAPFDNATAIGNNALVDASNKVRVGNPSVTSYSCQVNWTAGSDARIKDNVQENVSGLTFIKELRPVTFHYNLEKQYALMGRRDTTNYKGKYDIEKIAFSGFLAQEVDAAAKKVGYDFSGVDKSGKVWGLRYAEFTVPLVKAVQELDRVNGELIIKNEKLENQIAAIIEVLSPEQKEKISGIAQVHENKLEQNNPNPFTEKTTINYVVSSDAVSASIIIRSLNGVELKKLMLDKNSKSVTIQSNDFAQGTYTYSLEVNGQSIDTKLMVITK